MSPHSGADTPSPNLHARLRDVADAFRAQAAVAVPKQANVHLVYGVVLAVNTGPPPSVNIAPGGVTDGSQWTNVAYLNWYTPSESENVLILVDGSDRIVVGTVSETIPTEITIDATVALFLGTRDLTATFSNVVEISAGAVISLINSAGTGTEIELYEIGGQGAIDLSADMMGFFRTDPVAQISASTLFTAADIINALQTYGIFGP